MTQPDLTYEQAHSRLEEIVNHLDSDSVTLRETLELCREGRTLLEFCAKELESVGRGLEELQLEELLSQLEQQSAIRQPQAVAPTSN